MCAEEVRNILEMILHKSQVMSEMRAMDDNMENAVARMRSMPGDSEEVIKMALLSPLDEMDDMRLALATMENHDQMLRSRMRSALLEDEMDADILPVDGIDLDSIPIGPIVEMEPNDVYKLFSIRRPDLRMRSMPLDINELSDYQIDWRPRMLQM